MAIDSAAKRRSAAGIPHHPLGPGVTPDASMAQAWRQTVAWGYSGILAGAPVAVVIETYTTALFCNPSPSIGIDSNPSPTVEVYNG